MNRGLFNKEIYNTYKILTNDRMQDIYLYATSERRRKGTIIEMVKEFLLIELPHNPLNISIITWNNTEVPGNNTNNTQSKITPTEDEVKLKELKKQYDSLKKEKPLIIKFIQANKPTFIEPYADIWNIWAAERGKAKLASITVSRRNHFKARLKESGFDFLAILTKAKDSQFLLSEKWFTFDWLTKNSDNYIKVLEGNYDNGEKEAAPAEILNSAEEKLLKKVTT